MIFALAILSTALLLSMVAAYYSVAGLTAIFSAAVIPVIIMGASLELGKVVATVWLHNNWKRISFLFKVYLVPAILFLMILTSMGIFGFLSKAHSDQGLISGDAISKVAIYDEKIATEKDNIASAKKAIEQMNAQVDGMLGRTETDRGAERAVQIRKNQAKERANLQAEINKAQKSIILLQEERAPLAAEFRKVEAEVGPIKYIAAFLYGDNPDQNVLEKAVRWVIILIVVVFDPLALCLILAANKQIEWVKEDKEKISAPIITPVGAMEPEQLPDTVLDIGNCYKCNTALLDAPGIGPFCPNKECDVADNVTPPEQQVADNDQFVDALRTQSELEQIHDEQADILEANAAIALLDPVEEIIELDEVPPVAVSTEPVSSDSEVLTVDSIMPVAEATADTSDAFPFPLERPEGTLEDDPLANVVAPTIEVLVNDEIAAVVENTEIEIAGVTKESYRRLKDSEYVEFEGKRMHEKVLKQTRPDLFGLQEDGKADKQTGFGTSFPEYAIMGDIFVRVDALPNRVFKFNGGKWIEVNREHSESYLTNNQYVQYLVDKIGTGEIDPEILTDSETDTVTSYITNPKHI